MPDFQKIAAKTAISRKGPSAPCKYLVKNNLIEFPLVLDYGCGKGDDWQFLEDNGYTAFCYDPNYSPNKLPFGVKPEPFNTVLCTYVLNVLPKNQEKKLLSKLCELGKSVFVTVRADVKVDGFTKSGTYQRNVELDYPLVHKTSFYRIYKVK
jgi:hypothetical protein